MMLEALIRTKKSIAPNKLRGDVICLKLKEFADWGSMEIRIHQPCPWVDERLEKLMREELDRSGIPPTEITPYKQSESVDFLNYYGELSCRKEVTKTRSRVYLNIDAITNEHLKRDVINDDLAVDLYKVVGIDIVSYIQEKTEEQINKEFNYNKILVQKEIDKIKPTPLKKETVSIDEEKLLEYYRNKINN